MIVLHAPQERDIESVKEVWDLATEPGLWLFVYCWWQSNATLICTYFSIYLLAMMLLAVPFEFAGQTTYIVTKIHLHVLQFFSAIQLL